MHVFHVFFKSFLLEQSDIGNQHQLLSLQSQPRSSNICGPEASCTCTKSTNETDVYILSKCKQLDNTTTLISKITVSKVRICQIESLAKYRKVYGLGLELTLIFQWTSIEHLVDMPEDCLPDYLVKIIFEENPKLIIPHMERIHMFNLAKTQYLKSGILKFVGDVYLSVIVQFTNFTTSMKNMYEHSFFKTKPWRGFASTDLILEGNFIDFPAFIGLGVKTVTIRNVKSLSGVQLMPENFMNFSIRLKNLSIFNSPQVKLPKHFFEFIFNPLGSQMSLTLNMDIENIQKNVFVGQCLKYLIRINQVTMETSTRAILESRNNVENCSIFCQTNGSIAAENCSKLSKYEKRVCGICVIDKIGPIDQNALRKICSIDDINPTTLVPSDTKTDWPKKKLKNEEGSYGYQLIQQKTFHASNEALTSSFNVLLICLILKYMDNS